MPSMEAMLVGMLRYADSTGIQETPPKGEPPIDSGTLRARGHHTVSRQCPHRSLISPTQKSCVNHLNKDVDQNQMGSGTSQSSASNRNYQCLLFFIVYLLHTSLLHNYVAMQSGMPFVHGTWHRLLDAIHGSDARLYAVI